jgi:hypothetical protein
MALDKLNDAVPYLEQRTKINDNSTAIESAGVLKWVADVNYLQDAYVVGSDGSLYKAILPNIGKDPVSSPSQWGLGAASSAQGDLADTAVQPEESRSGVWLISSGTSTRYADFASAYTAATTGDTIELSAGLHDLGAVIFTYTKSVSIFGKGSHTSILKANGFKWGIAATNCMLQGFQMTQDVTDGDELFNTTGITASDVLNVRWMDMFLDSPSLTAPHTMQWGGDGITLDNVRTRSSNDHPFAFKGAKNVIIRNCESFCESGTSGNGLLIKGDIGARGLCSDFFVDGFKSNSNVYIDMPSSNEATERVKLYNLELGDLGGVHDSVIKLGSTVPGKTGRQINDFHIDGVVGTGRGGIDLVFFESANNLSIRNVTIDGIVTSGATRPYRMDQEINEASTDLNFENIKLITDDDWTLHINQSSTLLGAGGWYSASYPNISNGVLSAQVRAAEQAASGIYVVVEAGFEPNETDLVIGDPVILEGGDHDGAYKLEEFATVTTINVPITGAQVGDYYIRITDSTTTTPEAVTAGDVWIGKVSMQLTNSNAQLLTYYGSAEGSGYWGSGIVVLPTLSTYRFSGGNHVGGTVELALSEDLTIAGDLIACKPQIFNYNGTVYAGLFVTGTATASIVPSSLKNGSLRLEKYSSLSKWRHGIKYLSVLP